MLMRRYHNKGYKAKKKGKAKKEAAYKRTEAEALTKAEVDELVVQSLVAKFRLSDLAGTNYSPLERIAHVINARNSFYRHAGINVNRHVTALSIPDKKDERRRMDTILTVLVKRARKLLQPNYYKAVLVLARIKPIKPVMDFRPKFKGAERTWREFVTYYVAGDYAVPEIFYKVLEAQDLPVGLFERIVDAIRGGSIFKLRAHLVMPLTKRMLSLSWNDDFRHSHWVGYFRAAQLKALGGGFGFVSEVNASIFGSSYGEPLEEEFRFDVIQWLVNNLDAETDLDQVGPVIDYVRAAYAGDPTYNMKGRTKRSLLRDVQIWHRNLQLSGDVYRTSYKTSGLKVGNWELKREPGDIKSGKRLITISEVLTSMELLAEGRTHNHCVYSYHREIVSGRSSIWSLRSDEKRAITIEVTDRGIVQARGKHNRFPKDWEKEYLRRWASLNQLNVRMF